MPIRRKRSQCDRGEMRTENNADQHIILLQPMNRRSFNRSGPKIFTELVQAAQTQRETKIISPRYEALVAGLVAVQRLHHICVVLPFESAAVPLARALVAPEGAVVEALRPPHHLVRVRRSLVLAPHVVRRLRVERGWCVFDSRNFLIMIARPCTKLFIIGSHHSTRTTR